MGNEEKVAQIGDFGFGEIGQEMGQQDKKKASSGEPDAFSDW